VWWAGISFPYDYSEILTAVGIFDRQNGMLKFIGFSEFLPALRYG
jgi:hypothetical protein